MSELKNTASNQSEVPSELENRAGQHGHHASKLDAIQEENAVGYKEYLEGLDMEITPKEVSNPILLPRVSLTVL